MKEEILKYIARWELMGYPNGIPDSAPIRLTQLNKVPSYKLICIAILNNDLNKLGICSKKSKYYDLLKKIELDGRNNQLKIF